MIKGLKPLISSSEDLNSILPQKTPIVIKALNTGYHVSLTSKVSNRYPGPKLTHFHILFLQDHKDRRIHELTMELDRQDRLCELYRDQLNTLLKYIEEQIEVVSGKVQVVVSNVNQVEKEAQKPPNQ